MCLENEGIERLKKQSSIYTVLMFLFIFLGFQFPGSGLGIGAVICATAGYFLARNVNRSVSQGVKTDAEIQSLFCGLVLLIWLSSFPFIVIWLLFSF